MLNKFYPLYLLMLGIVPFIVMLNADSYVLTSFMYAMSISFFVLFGLLAYLCWTAKR
tara:strand:- start:1033 stop:1203 length:171 start_codon:yes stop_codon:yes gene_type:complete